MSFSKLLRTLILQNNYGRLLLYMHAQWNTGLDIEIISRLLVVVLLAGLYMYLFICKENLNK